MSAPVWSENLDRATCRICGLVFVDGWHYLEHLREHRKRRARLAPLAPQAFVTWSWEQRGRPGSGPLILEDWLFELRSRDPTFRSDWFWKDWYRLAARVRRNQRLGLNAWEGIV